MFRSWILLAWTALVCAPAGQASPDWTGSYTVPLPDGAMTMTLKQSSDGAVTGTVGMPGGAACELQGDAVQDEDEEWTVVGSIHCPNGRSDFDLSADQDGEFVLLVTPHDEVGTPRLDLAAVLYARRGTSDTRSEDPTDPARASPDKTRDPRLVGVWATQVVMNTPAGSMATQMLMEIRSDGTLVDLGSRSLGGMLGTGLEGGGDVGMWRTQGNVLQLCYAGSPWVTLATFEVTGNRLLLAYFDGDRKLWNRQ